MRLTETARQLVATHLAAGDWAIDATAGNGHDTLFLAERVGSTGHVFAFDIQPAARDATAARLATRFGAIPPFVTLIAASHDEMAAHLPARARGRIAAVMFNLGYLPGADKRIVTMPDTTVRALSEASALLAPGGIVCVMAYRGHPGGAAETCAVETWLSQQPAHWTVQRVAPPAVRETVPLLFILRRPS